MVCPIMFFNQFLSVGFNNANGIASARAMQSVWVPDLPMLGREVGEVKKELSDSDQAAVALGCLLLFFAPCLFVTDGLPVIACS